jgi:SAM-dependent methyltransferase
MSIDRRERVLGGRSAQRGRTMTTAERILAVNRAGWNQVAPSFHGGTALPEYGPLAPTEDTLRLLEITPELRALELGCGSGHSLRYLAERGARELWGLDLSPVQVGFAKETLRECASRTRLFESPMEVNPGIPTDYFDLVFSLWGLGWTVDLPATMALVAQYLRPGGCFLLSGEHPAYSCIEWNGRHYVVSEPYTAEGAREHASWKGVPIVIHRRTLATFVGEIIGSGLQLEALIEGAFNSAKATDSHRDPARWYSVDRARLVPTTFIIKARKPRASEPPLI